MHNIYFRSSSCPQCRTFNPKTHKIYLELNDDEPNTENLQKQLQECRTKLSHLELELKRAYNNNASSTANSTTTSKSLQVLEEALMDSLSYSDNLEKQLKDSETKIRELQNRLRDKKTPSRNATVNTVTSPDVTGRLKRYIFNLIRQTSLNISGAQINTGNLVKFVLYLCHKMDNNDIVRRDIIKATLLDNILTVQFRNPEHKDYFLQHSYKLDYHYETENIQFSEVTNDPNDMSLFDYALNLKLFNYKAVFRRGPNVLARKDDGEEAVYVFTKKHVEELIEKEVVFL